MVSVRTATTSQNVHEINITIRSILFVVNILYVVNTFPSLSESFVINELHELEKRGHDVSVFALHQPEEQITHKEIAEMDVSIYYGTKPNVGSFPYLFSQKVFNRDFLSKTTFVDSPLWHAVWLHLGRQISEVVEEEKADLVHAHFATPEHTAITYAADYHDIPATVTAHAIEIFASPNKRRLRRFCELVDHVIVPSEYNREYLINNVGVTNEITVVPATTRVDKFPAKPGKEVEGRLLTVGRLVEKKGHEYAISAVAQLLDKGYEIEYHIIGKGRLEESLKSQVKELGIEDNVTFLGHVSDDMLVEELHEASIFALPCVVASNGDRDAMPVVLKEAMATETLCVSTQVSAIPELITHGKDGMLVSPRDADELANVFQDILEKPEKRRTMAVTGRQTVETKFDITACVDKLENVFNNTVC